MANQFSIDVDQSNDGIKVVSVPKTWLEGGNAPNWITPVVNYGMTSGGILIPQRVDSEGRPEVTLNGSKVALSSNPETGVKTVTSTAAEIFAGNSRKIGRSIMYIRNLHDSIAIRIGSSDISDTKGRRILPQQEIKIEFDPQSDIPLYAVSEYGNVEVEVFEA